MLRVVYIVVCISNSNPRKEAKTEAVYGETNSRELLAVCSDSVSINQCFFNKRESMKEDKKNGN